MLNAPGIEHPPFDPHALSISLILSPIDDAQGNNLVVCTP